MKRTLAVDLGAGLVLPTPVHGRPRGARAPGASWRGLVDLRKVGAVVSRSITLEPDRGTPDAADRRVGRRASVWSTGLQNPGHRRLRRRGAPATRARGAHVIVSIAGGTLEEYVRMTGALQGRPEVAALEVHLSGPDVELQRDVLGAARRPRRRDRRRGRPDVPRAGVREAPALGERRRRARRGRAVRAGAHGLTLGGSPPALVGPGGATASRARRRHRVAQRPGDQADDARARSSRSRARSPTCPSMAVGGIRTGEDAVEALLAGAWAVQVGTAMLIDPAAPVADRSGGRPVPEGQGARVARRRPRAPAGARVVRRARARRPPRDPAPREPADRRARRVATSRRPSGSPPTLAPHAGMLKVGLELFWAHGPEAVRRIASHGQVFVDAKLHDIPNTVERAAANIARLGVDDAERPRPRRARR